MNSPSGTAVAPETRAARPRASVARGLGPALSPSRISGVYLLVAMVIFFALAADTFFTTSTLRTIATEQAVTAIVAVGLTVALAAGVFDLSIAGSMGLANIVAAKLMVDAGMSPVVAVLLTLVIGAVIGIFNGLLVTAARIDPFIATLGTGSILTAVIFVTSDNTNVLGVPQGFQEIASNQIAGIPLPVFYVIALGLIVWYLMAWTPVGRRLYATGGGRDVARLAGIPTTRYVIAAFIASAVVASLAGILVMANIGAGATDVGPSYLLPAFAAGFLGATQFRPGRYNVWGTILAVYLLATGVKGLVLMGADVWVPDLFNGVALITAVGLAGLQRRAKVKEDVGESDPAAETTTATKAT
jgi:ribose transport system permease protein